MKLWPCRYYKTTCYCNVSGILDVCIHSTAVFVSLRLNHLQQPLFLERLRIRYQFHGRQLPACPIGLVLKGKGLLVCLSLNGPLVVVARGVASAAISDDAVGGQWTFANGVANGTVTEAAGEEDLQDPRRAVPACHRATEWMQFQLTAAYEAVFCQHSRWPRCGVLRHLQRAGVHTHLPAQPHRQGILRSCLLMQLSFTRASVFDTSESSQVVLFADTQAHHQLWGLPHGRSDCAHLPCAHCSAGQRGPVDRPVDWGW